MLKISALVLAAGESKRMGGRNKLLLPLAGQTMIECVVESIGASLVDEVVVVLGHEAEIVQRVLSRKKLRFVFNPNYRQGMASSIHAGLAQLSPEAQAVLIALADQPLIAAAEIDFIINAFSRATDKTIGVPTFNGQRGHPVLFDLQHRSEMLALQGDVGCKSILARHSETVLEIPLPTRNILEDADTPEAYAHLQTVLR